MFLDAGRVIALAYLLSLLLGCASSGQYARFQNEASLFAGAEELPNVPFFPQDDYQCGPAALATVMVAAGQPVSPKLLEPQIYLAGRKGSLQLELIAAARRHGLLPYEHGAGFSNLLLQLQAGQPVLVLQNLGLSWAPTWHYAVVVGYRPDSEQVLLRSGRTRLQALPLKEFERTWRYSDYWAITLHQPGSVPADAELSQYLQAVAGLEETGQLPEARAAYKAAVRSWPQQSLAWMGLGNSHYQLKQYVDAEQAYRKAAALTPDYPAAWHNLAWSLIRQNKGEEARTYASKAVHLAGPDQSAYSSALKALEFPAHD